MREFYYDHPNLIWTVSFAIYLIITIFTYLNRGQLKGSTLGVVFIIYALSSFLLIFTSIDRAFAIQVWVKRNRSQNNKIF